MHSLFLSPLFQYAVAVVYFCFVLVQARVRYPRPTIEAFIKSAHDGDASAVTDMILAGMDVNAMNEVRNHSIYQQGNINSLVPDASMFIVMIHLYTHNSV